MKLFVLLLLVPGIIAETKKPFVVPADGTVPMDGCTYYYLGKLVLNIHAEVKNDSLLFCFNTTANSAPLANCLQVPGANGTTQLRGSTTTGAHYIRTTSIPIFCSILLEPQGSNLTEFIVYQRSTSGIVVATTLKTGVLPFNITASYNGTQRFYDTIKSKRSKNVFIQSCRTSSDSDEVVMIGQYQQLPSTCASRLCSYSAMFQSSFSNCGVLEECQGNNVCLLPLIVCTVTGSSVIDFNGKLHSISDRCTYTLVKSQTSLPFKLHAGFRERRRKDVSFLDHLIITYNGSTVTLGQGGSLLVDGVAQTLTKGNGTFGSLKIKKDQAGMTVKLPLSNMNLLFDGNTAYVSGLKERLTGLCGNTVYKTSESKPIWNPNFNPPSCQTAHKDTSNSTIDCQRAKTQCDRIEQSPFTACHSLIDPKPFVSACNKTLCSYPEADGFNACHFMGVYAKICRMHDDALLVNWTSSTNCPRQDFCQNQYCSDHEFCGILGDEPRCYCRAFFNTTGYFGEPAVCTQNNVTKILANCLLNQQGFNYSKLHLNDPACRGRLDPKNHMVTFSYNSSNCGTEVMMNNSRVVFKNKIMTSNSTGNITRQDVVAIDFSCYYNEPEIKSVSLRIKHSSLVQRIVSGPWNYTLTMKVYADPALNNLVGPSTVLQLNQKVWVELKTQGLDSKKVALVTDSCWATNNALQNSGMRHNLIMKGCSSDETVTTVKNGRGTSSVFSFNMFQFTNGPDAVYLHCRLELCIMQQGQSCVPMCGKRRRRSVRADPNPALVTMIWTK